MLDEVYNLTKMKNIKELFRRNPSLLEKPEVKQLLVYIQELEGEIFDNNLKQDKQHIFKGIVEDIVISCKEYRENKLLEERYPNQYQKIDADHLINNLCSYISEINRINNLGII